MNRNNKGDKRNNSAIGRTSELPPLPAAFEARVLADFGEQQGEALLAALREKPTTGVRLNPRKSGQLPGWFEQGEPVEWCPSGYYLAERPDFTLTPALHAGAFYVQEPSSMIHEHIVRELAGEQPVRLLDLCAAPGGKSTAAIASLPAGSLAVSNEVVGQRAVILAENIAKWGYPAAIVTSAAADVIGNSGAQFDIILLDAPCSGEGMMRKEAEAIRQWTPGLNPSCAALQRQIANDILPALREGGYLVYSTCTFSRAENEENVRYLLDNYPLESVDMGLEKFGISRSSNSDQFSYCFLPHLTRGEGLFVSVMRLTAPTGKAPRAIRSGRQKSTRKHKPQRLPQWLRDMEAYSPIEVDDRIYVLEKEHLDIYNQLRAAGVRFLSAGVEFGTRKREDIIPAHALALSTALREDAFPRVELSEKEALLYLRREAVTLPDDTQKGYVLVCHGGYPLGLMKNLGNRANSLYPTNWKIRKSI